MIDIKLFRINKDLIITGLKKKNFKDPESIVNQIILDDERYREFLAKKEKYISTINENSGQISKFIGKDEMKVENLKLHVKILKDEIEQLDISLENIKERLDYNLHLLPNLPHSSVPEGYKPEHNSVVKIVGTDENGKNLWTDYEKRKPHWDIIKEYNLISFELGNKITGNGFPVFIGQGARLQRALIQYFLDFNISAGYTEYSVPHMVNKNSAYGTGQLPDKEGQMYHATQDDLYLIPTAEVPLTNVYRDDIVTLPIKMTGHTPCFRREAGSYGKEVRGLNRVHQFDKVEIVQLVEPEKSYDVLEEMVNHVENLLKSLELPYRILKLCGGDMSHASALTYDFEVYSKAQDMWLEVSSVSNFETFQSNRMKIRYKDENKKNKLVHTLNGSSLALPRIIACLLENNQTNECIKLPELLVPYFGKNIITI